MFCTLSGVAFWGAAAAAYGAVMALAALSRPVKRRHVAFSAAVAFSLVSIGVGTLTASLWVNLVAPGGLLLCGYWLSGMLFQSPQPWLEAWLLKSDRALGADLWIDKMPRRCAEFLEGTYTAVYVVVGGGAIFAAIAGLEEVTHYWNLVLTSALASYAPLPWLRSRPPRVLEAHPAGGATTDQGRLRRLNSRILDRASVQANTLPSGHVSSAVAAALGVLPVSPTIGWILMAGAAAIAVAAVAGRYHYAIDCLAGACVALLVFFVL